jgi:aminopeptidase N
MYFHEDGARYRRTICTKHYDEPIDVFDHHLYDKAGRVLHMLRPVLGDDLLWKSLAHYLDKHRHGVVETRDLARAIEDATGRVLDWFFSQWILDATCGQGPPGRRRADGRPVEQTIEQDRVTEAAPGQRRRRRRRRPRERLPWPGTPGPASRPRPSSIPA